VPPPGKAFVTETEAMTFSWGLVGGASVTVGIFTV